MTIMQKRFFIVSFFTGLIPAFAYASTPMEDFIDSGTSLLATFIPILLGVSVLVFFWGLVKFIAHADDEKTHEDGKQLMVWGMIAIFVMVSLWAIIGYIQAELGLDVVMSPITLPAQPNTIPTPP